MNKRISNSKYILRDTPSATPLSPKPTPGIGKIPTCSPTQQTACWKKCIKENGPIICRGEKGACVGPGSDCRTPDTDENSCQQIYNSNNTYRWCPWPSPGPTPGPKPLNSGTIISIIVASIGGLGLIILLTLYFLGKLG